MDKDLKLNELQSKNWDCSFTLDTLIEYNNDLCLLDVNYPFTSDDDCYHKFALALKLPGEVAAEFVYIGAKEDGLTCIAEGRPYIGKEYLILPYGKALMFMLKYIDFMNTKSSFEMKLRDVVDECAINIIYDNDYETQHTNCKDFTINKTEFYPYNYEVKSMKE